MNTREKSELAGAIIVNLCATAPANLSRGSCAAIIHDDNNWKQMIGRVRFDTLPDAQLQISGSPVQTFDTRDPDFFDKLVVAVHKAINAGRKRFRARRDFSSW